MDFFEAQEFFKKMFPDKLLKFEFDEKCYYSMECILTEGIPNIMHHVECRKVKVSVDGMPDQYVPIKPHRFGCCWADLKRVISNKEEVWLDPNELKEMRKLKEENSSAFDTQCRIFQEMTGMSQEQIISKIEVK